jgi:acid phosphatase (class A)
MMRQVMAVQALFAGVLLVLCPAGLRAEECRGQSSAPLVKLLPPPPCETCEETKAEMDELADLERTRTPGEVKHATEDAERSVARFLEGAGIQFDAKKLKKCNDFFLMGRKQEKGAVDEAKDTFCRLRPFLTPGNSLHPVQDAKPDSSYSYPSGHATFGATIGFLLAAMLPEKRAEIYARINDYAHSRMVAGVHFRSDVEAGKLFGAAVGTEILANPDTRPDFKDTTKCVREAVGLE